MVNLKGGKMINRIANRLLYRIFKYINLNSNLIATYDLVDPEQFFNILKVDSIKSGIGILVQGPIIKKTTRLNLRLLKHHYPNNYIVFSTWSNQDLRELSDLEDGFFHIILNDKPEYCGVSNINMQIASTKTGLNYLAALNCTHVLKTRSDIILTNSYALRYFMHQFSQTSEPRLVFSSFNSFLNRPYSVTDQVMFSTTKLLMQFWDLDLVSEDEQIYLVEEFLFTRFLAKQGFEPKYTIDSYLSALKEYANFVDHELIGQVWNKGTYTSLTLRWRNYGQSDRLFEITSWKWKMLCDNIEQFKDTFKEELQSH